MSASPIHGILQDASMVDYPGRLAAVFFLGGCNFRCGFCHNASLLAGKEEGLPWKEVEAIARRFRRNWVDAAVVTGGEPTCSRHVFHTVEKLREWGFRIKLDTNGSRPDVLKRLLPLVEGVAMDVKFAPANYPAHTGFSDLAALTESIRLIREQAAVYEFRTTVVEAWHGPEEMRAIGEWVKGARRHVLQAFVPRSDLPDPTCSALAQTSGTHLHAMADVLRPYVEQVEIRGEF
ncbi:MAG: anaerobic ribonucleoside-triphosphate reductase activating protein [Verrucomicrobiota bacterium]|nr:anaerobic ribonucleoside-triphosphate reductase activating protein [Verrucomicrobiota bacterium]